MTAKEYLQGIATLQREITALEGQLERLRDMVMPKSPVIDDMPKSHTVKDPLAEYAAQAEEVWKELDARKLQYQRALMDAELRLSRIEDDRHRYILREHYCAGKPLSVVAAEMFLSPSRVYHLHLEALKAFPVPESWERLGGK